MDTLTIITLLKLLLLLHYAYELLLYGAFLNSFNQERTMLNALLVPCLHCSPRNQRI
jgi:hypothetical protein